jgi:seryl-tRNA synthetase
MHDVRAIRDDPEAYDRAWALRGLGARAPAILSLDGQVRAAQTALQAANARRNEASRLIGQAKASGDDALAKSLMAEVDALKGAIAANTAAQAGLAAELHDLLAALPNLPAPDVPAGADESGNVEIRRWGEAFALADAKDHVDLGAALGMMDFEAAARMSGARFVVLRAELARLERALGQFMLDFQTSEGGFIEISPPLLVRDHAVVGTAQRSSFYEDLYTAADPAARSDLLFRGLEGLDDAFRDRGAPHGLWKLIEEVLKKAPTAEGLYLIPTAEVPLANLVREQILSEEDLPLRFTALTPCFRAEAGASGKDTRGMIRQHQFNKVELVSITTPEQSQAEHERIVNCAEAVLKRLELPFRTVLLCAGDMGFSAAKTYDLEVWLPSQETYREISSCSNCGDFQARRMDARCKRAGEKGTRFVHTLNGSGLAVGRALVAVMENYQDEGGRIAVPQALHLYMRGATHIGGEA